MQRSLLVHIGFVRIRAFLKEIFQNVMVSLINKIYRNIKKGLDTCKTRCYIKFLLLYIHTYGEKLKNKVIQSKEINVKESHIKFFTLDYFLFLHIVGFFSLIYLHLHIYIYITQIRKVYKKSVQRLYGRPGQKLKLCDPYETISNRVYNLDNLIMYPVTYSFMWIK